MLMRYLLILLIFALTSSYHKAPIIKDSITIDCGKKTNNMDTVKRLIAAKYQWVKTHFIDRGIDSTVTPQSKNQLETYIFL